MKKTCAVIGSGIAGLAVAIRVAAKGYAVDVYEANATAGGKIKEQYAKGYRFDMGPSVWMLPELVDELFTLCGKNARDYFSYSPIDLTFKYFYEDGTIINGYADAALFGEEIARKTTDTKSSFDKYLKDIAVKYNIVNEVFIENSLHKAGNFFNRKVLSGIFNAHKIDPFKTMDEGNRQFFHDPKTVQLFNSYATYVGSNPFSAPATMNVIPHLELSRGAYLPDAGMYTIVAALVKLAREMGVKFYYNTTVEEIISEDGHVAGIRTVDSQNIKYRRVVSNVDVYYTYKKLLPHVTPPKMILNSEKSSSVIGFYWGINKEFPELGIHNMLFAANDRAEYDAVFEQHTLSNDPSLYIFITSKHIKQDAPVGCENWFVLITAPNEQGQDWQGLIQKTRQNAVNKINRLLDTDIEKYIDYEDVINPVLIKNNYATPFGAVYGNSSNSKFAAFLRHPNFSKKVKGLYFVGGSVHPGAGIPLCLNSAKIVGKLF